MRIAVIFTVGLCLSTLACGGSRMTRVPRYQPRGPVNERILNEAKVQGNIAFELYQTGRYPQALTAYQTTLSNLYLIDHEQEIANIRHNLSHVYLALGDYPRAKFENNQALQANQNFGFATRLALNLATAALIAEKEGDPQRALDLYDEALTILSDNRGSPRDIGIQHNNRGYLLLRQKQYPEAIREFFHALDYLVPVNAYGEIGASYSGIGEIHFVSQRFRLARLSFSNALSADKAGELSPMIAIDLKNLGRASEALEEYEAAIDFHHRALRIETSLKRVSEIRENLNALIRLQTLMGNQTALRELNTILYNLGPGR